MTTAQKKSALRPFQERVLAHQMQGNNVLLQAPTGAGKTRGALAPYLQNLAHKTHYLPQSCRYAVPMRVLANQFYQEYATIDRKVDQRLKDIYAQFGREPVLIQTGEQPSDPHFESALTFCTIDQLLASFIGIPYGIGKRRANMNVGAVVGSYLVLDEFHLYPLGRNGKGVYGARTTALAMLQLLNEKHRRLAPFTLMTATFSSQMLKRLGDLLEAEIVEIDATAPTQDQPSELEVLNAGRERRFMVHSTPMEAGEIVDMHQDCTLVVCNTVARAQEMYRQISTIAQERGIETILLHSRFTDEDRRHKQEQLEQALGASSWEGNRYLGRDVIVVATQVVEVGLDISVRTLHSEIAPANSVIQRAGRCARFAQQHGSVHLYPLAEGIRHLPYDSQLSQATLDAFAQFDGQIVDFTREQQVIDAVHTDEDRAMLDLFQHDRGEIVKKIFEGLGGTNPGVVSELIRDVQQSTIVIHSDPKSVLTERPWDWQTFSLSPYTLQARWEDIRSHDDDTPVMWQAQLLPDQREEGTRVPDRYTWEPVRNAAQIPMALMIALSPSVASYTSEFGFQLRDSRSTLPWPQTPFESQLRPRRKPSRDFAPYQQEGYAEHIRGLLDAFNTRLWDETCYVAMRLDTLLNLPPDSVKQAIRLAIACHDIGKLSVGWQQWALAWQQKLVDTFGEEMYQPHKMPFAHTDYDWQQHREYARGFQPVRPNHAGESAAFALYLVHAITNDVRLTKAITAAIARHHSAETKSYSAQQLIPDARRHIDAILQEAQIPIVSTTAGLQPIARSGELDADYMVIPRLGIDLETWLYFVLVRVLRLADERSFSYR